MAVQLTDLEIARLVLERKRLPQDYRSRMVLRSKRGHRQRELDVVGADGNEFRVILRQSVFNAFDFSAILAYCPPKTNQIFRLRRYNGRSHEHTNSLEQQTFYAFHVHLATQRYQELGSREDTYAEPTDRYADYQQAVRCLLADCAFDVPESPQGSLFTEE